MTRGARRLAGALGAAVLAAGCVTGPVVAPPVASALPAEVGRASPVVAPRTWLLHVPFHPQRELHCGPAALATALGADGVDVPPDVLADAVFLPARGGSLQAEMLAGARRHGRVATRIPPTTDALLQAVAAGQPVVVLQNLGLAIAPLWHYAVVVGYDLPERELLLRSGTVRELRLSLRTFGHTWARSGHWGFVVHAPGDWPAVATQADVESAAVGFERVAPPGQAATAYASALARHPGSLPLAMGLGNARYAAGDRAGAAQAFEAAARRHDSPAAWINLALTRHALGDGVSALAAAQAATAAAGRPGEDRWRTVAHDALRAVTGAPADR